MFTPKFYFKNIYEITPQFLTKNEIKGVILDIDNTLVYYGIHKPSPENTAWIASLREHFIKIAFVSNGYEARVKEYNEEFGFYYSYKSGKPRVNGFLKAAESLALKPQEIAVIGDQIFTDILGGNLAKMTSILVEPIQMEPWLSFKIKRFLERPLLKKIKKTESEK